DGFEFRDAADRSHHLDPAVVLTGRDAIDLVEGVVAVFLVPQISSAWIDRQAEGIANAIGIDFLNIRANFAAELSAKFEKGIGARCRTVVIETKDHAREMGIVRLRAAELVIGNARAEWSVDQVLQLSTSAIIANYDEQPRLFILFIFPLG